MVIMEFKIRCPACETETKIVAHEANPIIFSCTGCHKTVVMQGSRVYTVSTDYMKHLMLNMLSLTLAHRKDMPSLIMLIMAPTQSMTLSR